MSIELHLSDAVLARVMTELTGAVSLMRARSTARPARLLGHGGELGEQIAEYASGVSTACAALSDAAHTAVEALSELVEQGSETDRKLAAVLTPGFAVPEV